MGTFSVSTAPVSVLAWQAGPPAGPPRGAPGAGGHIFCRAPTRGRAFRWVLRPLARGSGPCIGRWSRCAGDGDQLAARAGECAKSALCLHGSLGLHHFPPRPGELFPNAAPSRALGAADPSGDAWPAARPTCLSLGVDSAAVLPCQGRGPTGGTGTDGRRCASGVRAPGAPEAGTAVRRERLLACRCVGRTLGQGTRVGGSQSDARCARPVSPLRPRGLVPPPAVGRGRVGHAAWPPGAGRRPGGWLGCRRGFGRRVGSIGLACCRAARWPWPAWHQGTPRRQRRSGGGSAAAMPLCGWGSAWARVAPTWAPWRCGAMGGHLDRGRATGFTGAPVPLQAGRDTPCHGSRSR